MENNNTMNESTDKGDCKIYDPEPDQGSNDANRHNSVSLDSPSWSLGEKCPQNPELIPDILHQIFDHLPATSMLKLRGTCKLWNELLVPKINKKGSVALLKIVNCDEKSEKLKLPFIDIKEVVETMIAGCLEHSILSRIYLDDSMKLNLDLFQVFLDMNGGNIRTLHYDGNSMEHLGRIFKSCSQNLVNLSLWYLLDPQKTWYKRNKNSNSSGHLENWMEDHIQFPKLESIVLVSGNDLHAAPSWEIDRYYLDLEREYFYPIGGRCNPSQKFLKEIMLGSPKFNSLSARFCDSSVLEALAETNSFKKLSTLCLKSRIDISQLRVLCCAGAEMKLKNLILRGLCVAMSENRDDYGTDTEDPNYKPRGLVESEKFASLVLEFLKTQANTLEFLSIHLFNKQRWDANVPVDELFQNFPIMPNLITLIMDKIEKRMYLNEFSILFPKLKNLGETPSHWKLNMMKYNNDVMCADNETKKDVQDISWLQEFPPLIIPSPESSSSLENLLGLNPTLDLVQVFPGITEFHSTIAKAYGPLPHRLPALCPSLKHLYFHIDLLKDERENVIKFIRRFNMFMVGIHPEECEEMEKKDVYHELEPIQLPRSRPSIFDLKALETLDIRFSCYNFEVSKENPSIQPALDVLITCGLSRMEQLKKLYVELDFKPCLRREEPHSMWRLKDIFGTKKNFKTQSNGFGFGWPTSESAGHTSGKRFVMEFNMDNHTSEWNQFNFFPDDPDIYNLGLQNDLRIDYVQKRFHNLP